jgi:putative hemolysin
MRDRGDDMNRLATCAVAFLGSLLCLAACDRPAAPPPPAAATPQNVQRANPASENCATQGGRHSVEKNPVGAEFGICLFEDNRQCEEWALMRGECPASGIKVTGFATPAARYCGITGGKYAVTARSGTIDEKGTCTLRAGKRCDADVYFVRGSICPAVP